MKRDVREAMQQWSKWRRARITAGIYWPSKSLLGKMMDGMPGTVCPRCRGRDGDCETCFGTGRVNLDPGTSKVNPAFISSTYRQPDDPQSELIDRLICELRQKGKTQKYFFVLWAEYVKPLGTQEIKATKMNISHNYYRYLLHKAHEMIEVGLENVRRKSA